MSIRYLIAVTAFVAIAFACLVPIPCVGFALLACLPLILAVPVSRSLPKTIRYATIILACLPIYLLSSGPMLALAFLTYDSIASKPEWPYQIHASLYPLPEPLDTDQTTLGKAVIEYHDQWCEIAGCERYSSVFETEQSSLWLWWVSIPR
jgi:hypothetical protein